jgi:hypothetical protein
MPDPDLTRQLSPNDATRRFSPSDATRQLGPNDATRQLSPLDATRPYGSDFLEEEEATRVFAAPPGWGAARSEWTVNLSDTDQRTMSTESLVDAYGSGTLPDDAYVWKDGMRDWVPFMDVPEIRDAIDSSSRTRVVEPEYIAEPEYVPEPPRQSSPVAYSPPAPPPASRAGRAARAGVEVPGRDLFGELGTTGAERELLSSSSENALERYEDKPTGARNDSSILFSMDAFRKGRSPPAAPAPRRQERADDVFSMGAPPPGPGLMRTDAALLTSPTVEEPPPPSPREVPRAAPTRDTTPPAAPRSKAGVLPYVLGGALGTAALLGAVWFAVLRPKTETPTAEPPETQAAAASVSPPETPAPAPAEEASPAPAPAPAAEEPAEPAAKQAAPAPALAPEPPRTANTAPKAAAPTAPSPKPAAATDTSLMTPMKSSDGIPKVVLDEEKSSGSAPAAEDKAEAPKPAAQAPAFDTGAAKAALGAASAGAATCKEPGGPTGAGKAQVTFSNSGRVTSANIVEGPFGGTSVGGCVAKKFRAATVPAFSGDSVTVAKSFRIPD